MDPNLPFLITRSPIAIHIYINDYKNMHRLVSLQNDNILSKNMNENKTIDSTIAGSITLIVN
jgi:hypothetical protein